MHAIKGSWAGQTFALATSNDSGGRKSRIRRSKEERKTMVESFIKKYQHSNNGNFPSLNLTHKEVGGSFYTVREIVREIIQENRVLAPPKVFSDFLEQNPLGSISIEPQIDSPISESVQIDTHVLTLEHQISSEENISITGQLNGSYPMDSDTEQIEGVIKVAEEIEAYDGTSECYQALNHYMIIKDEKIVNGIEPLEENSHFDNRQENNESSILSSQEINGQKNEELERENVTKSMDILDEEKCGAQDVEASKTGESRVNSFVVVETFPLRPLPGTIHNIDIEAGNLREADGTLEAIRSSSDFDDAEGEEKITDEKAVLNHQGLPWESSKHSSDSNSLVLGMGDVADLGTGHSLPIGTKGSSMTVGTKASGQDNTSLPKENNPTLDRINLETWEGTSKKSTQPESNPLLALVKAFISSLLKFWTE